MPYRLINKDSDIEGTLCADRDDAVGKLETLLETSKARESLVEEHHVIGEEFPSYKITDKEGKPVGDFTITLE